MLHYSKYIDLNYTVHIFYVSKHFLGTPFNVDYYMHEKSFCKKNGYRCVSNITLPHPFVPLSITRKQQTTEYELGLNTDSWVTMMVSKNTHEWIISALAGRILDPKDNVSKHSIFIVNGSMGPIMCSIFWRIFFPNPLGSRELVSPFLFLNESTRVYLPGKLAKTKWVGKYVTATMENLIILPPLSCCC